MSHLEFLLNLTKEKVPHNQAKLLLYLKDNPNAFQKDMCIDLKMEKNVVCMNINLFIARRWVIQNGTYNNKTHILAEQGIDKVNKLLEV